MPDEIHVLDFLPAYALGSLDADEAGRVSEHLRVCLICRAELEGFQNVVEQLGFAAPPVVPPPNLKSRLIQRIKTTQPQPETSTRGTSRLRLERLLSIWSVASLVLIFVLAVLNLSLWQRMNRLEFATAPGGMRAIPLSPTEVDSRATGFIIVSADGDNGALVVDGLPPLDADRQYQLWLIRDGERVSGAIFSTDEENYGGTRIKIDGSLLEYSSVGVTIEPTGGSLQPTGTQVLTGQLFAP